MYLNSWKLLLLGLLIFTFTACSDSKPEKIITSFSNDLESHTLDVNRTISMKVYAHYSDGTQSDVTASLLWKSSDESIAKVSLGNITSGDKTGSVEITYETMEQTTSNLPFYTESETFNVTPLLLTSMSISPSPVSLYENASTLVEVTGTFINPTSEEESQQNITLDCVFLSADTSIATVSQGVIHAIKEGNTTVSATNKNISASVDVIVEKIHITKIEIYSTKNEFNAQQTITLSVLATMDTNETVVLDNSDVLYTSEDRSIVTLDGNIATAVAVGNTQIRATLHMDSSFTTAKALFVLKENYVRIFKGEKELDLSYSDTARYETLPDDLDTFTLRAVGEDSRVENLQVKDGDGTLLSATEASFDNLRSGDILYKDENLTFSLIHNGRITTLEYSFEFITDPKTTFSQRYESVD